MSTLSLKSFVQAARALIEFNDFEKLDSKRNLVLIRIMDRHLDAPLRQLVETYRPDVETISYEALRAKPSGSTGLFLCEFTHEQAMALKQNDEAIQIALFCEDPLLRLRRHYDNLAAQTAGARESFSLRYPDFTAFVDSQRDNPVATATVGAFDGFPDVRQRLESYDFIGLYTHWRKSRAALLRLLDVSQRAAANDDTVAYAAPAVGFTGMELEAFYRISPIDIRMTLFLRRIYDQMGRY